MSELPADLVPVVYDAVLVLPGLPVDDPADRYGLRTLTAVWLAGKKSAETRRGYFRDLSVWLVFCDAEQLDVLTARAADVARFQAVQTGAPASTYRRLAAISSWYKFLVLNGKMTFNPCDGVGRPTVNRDESSTASLDVQEMRRLLRAADDLAAASAEFSPRRRLAAMRDRAVLRMLADLGLRRSEIVGLDLDSLSSNRGHRTVRYVGKGGAVRERSMSPHLLEALDEYLAVRGDGPGALFVTMRADGSYGRLDAKSGVFDVVRRVAKAAELDNAERLGAHSMRHSFATNALEAGVQLRHVQDGLGHADPRTTRRYDRSRNRLSNEPGLLLGGLYTTD